MSGASFLGIRWNGRERAPLLPHTPPPFGCAYRTFPSVEPLHDFFEYLTAMFKIVEHVERGAGRREQHDAARSRDRARPIDGVLERRGERHRNGRGPERGA